MRRAALIGAMALAAAGVAACGGGGKLSRAAFLSKADAQCRTANRAPQPGPARTAQEAVRNSRQEAKLRQQLADRLAKLHPPSSLAKLWSRYQTLTKQIIAGYRAETAAAQARDPRKFNRIDQQIASLQRERARIAGQIGFKVCGGAISPRSLADPATIRNVDLACREANRVALSAQPQPKSPTDAAAFAKAGPTVLKAQRQALSVVQAQHPPSRVSAVYGRFSSAFADRVKVTQQQVAAGKAGDKAKLAALNRQDAVLVTQREAPAAQQLGFEVCGVQGTGGV